jgi:hypothetical protein
MSNNFSLQQLTEGIRQRHLGAQNKRLVEKWSRTGLLRGLDGTHRENMARMLENQASQVLKEASDLGSGTAGNSDIRGFTNVAFPIVRRVFGGLVANELVSIQPMSLPSGLLFYLDYAYGTNQGGSTAGFTAYGAGKSIYNNPVGKGVRSGSLGSGGQYDLAGTGYSRKFASVTPADLNETAKCFVFAGGATKTLQSSDARFGRAHATGSDGKLLQYDPQLTAEIESGNNYTEGIGQFFFLVVPWNSTNFASADTTAIQEIALVTTGALVTSPGNHQLWPEKFQGGNTWNLRRLNQLGTWDGTSWTSDPLIAQGAANAHVLMVLTGTHMLALEAAQSDSLGSSYSLYFPERKDLSTGDGDTLVVPSFESTFTSNEPTTAPVIPEIDIKIESVAVTAVTRKLKARWSPELAQDLNAYHSLDAEVELTQILSEQIALELDREILNDLLRQASGANLYWSRAPGKFLNKETGTEVSRTDTLAPGPAFTGTVREWYETLTETIIDVANSIHRKTLRGSANFIVVGPDVATILESSVLYKPVYTLDGDGQVGAPMTLGADKAGTLSNRFTVYKDPYFPRNKVLVGYKGGSYLETGYVYAPYVPLIVTPTIFAPEDFTPRKGVMTRYGKKMVRSDFYGTVTIADMNVI